MNRSSTTRRISRREFLKLAGLTAAASFGACLLDTYRPWLEYPDQVLLTAKESIMDLYPRETYIELIRAASLAASGHNTQPWKFELLENEIRIHPDYTRRLPVVDPQDREMWISLGCALENLLVAAMAAGLACRVTYPDAEEVISIRFEKSAPAGGALYDAIAMRQNTRSEYDGLPLETEVLAKLGAVKSEPGTRLKFFDRPGLDLLAGHVRRGNLIQYADPAFKEELIAWLRFNKNEAMNSGDGLYSRCSGNPEVPRFLGRMFVTGIKPEAQAGADEKKLLSSSGAVIIAAASDSRADCVRTGQTYERLALTMASVGIKSAFLNQPVEVPALRGEFQKAAGLDEMLPQLLVRYGRAADMPRSLRRPVDQVILGV